MSASWNNPALVNKISDDVPAIKSLLIALLKMTDANTEDVPIDAKRLQEVTGGVQFQNYTGSAWANVGKLMHDVDMLDGKHASSSATADTIPVRDANGRLAGDILGNANTATTAASVAAGYVVPVANGGTGASDEAGARTNLGTNNAANITEGVLAIERGGTGSGTKNFVDLSTNQTIGGNKTFSGEVTLNRNVLKMTVLDTTENSSTTRTDTVLQGISSNTDYGITALFGASGNAVIGAGEGKGNLLAELAGNTGEDVYIIADGAIHFHPNANTYANRKSILLNASGELSGLAKVSSTSFVGALTGNVTGNCSGSSGSCTGNAATATKVVATVANDKTGELVRGTMGTNDAFRIAVGGASNAGWAEIATADDYNEPIYVRQYQGDFATLKRTVTLLDASGNSSFPGTITATFKGNVTGNCSGSSGSCTGNAATATKATNDSAGNNINTTYIKALSVSGKTITYTKGNGTTGTITTQDTVYTHPTTAGNKHIPSGGSSGQFLGWSAAGTAKWVNNPNTDTKYSNFTAPTDSASGKAGLVPAPPKFGTVDTDSTSGVNNQRCAHILTSKGWVNNLKAWNTMAYYLSSDKRLKQDFSKCNEKLLDTWEDVKWCQFKFKEDVKNYKNHAKINTGLVVQDLHDIFDKHKVSYKDYELTLHYTQEPEEAQYDDKGNLIYEAQPAVDEWRIDYTQALSIEAAYQRRRASRAEARIAVLEERLAKLEAALLK